MRILKIIFLLLALSPLLANAQRIVRVGEGYSQTSVNTAVFRNSAITTWHDKQYISYYDGEGYVTVGTRLTDDTVWTLRRTQYKGNVRDAHNVISLAADGDGYLHIAFDHHDSRLRYCRSIAPDTIVFGDEEAMTGTDEESVTYPEFYRLADGDLLFVYRSGASGRGDMVMNRYATRLRKWERMHDTLIDGEGERSAYWQMCVDALGTIHLSWVWRETWMVETNHDLCYARSKDGGKTWERSDGTPYQLPITAANAEYACHIPQGSELINQTGMCADDDGNPYIATYWRDADSDIPQYRLVYNDGMAWHTCQVGERATPFSLSGGGTKMIPIARPKMVIDGKKVYYIFRDEERDSKVSMGSATLGEDEPEWTMADLTGQGVEAWEPCIDNELWKSDRRIDIFVQHTHQGDGERSIDASPTDVFVVEINPKKIK